VTGDWQGLRGVLLIGLAAHVVAWPGFVTLIALSVVTEDPLPRFLLLAWVVIALTWLGISIGEKQGGTSWWGMILLAPSLPLLNAIRGTIRWWRGWSE